MKNTKIMAVLAVLLISALCVGAVSAERSVEEGQSAFVFEDIKIIGTDSGSLIQYSDGANPTVLNVIKGEKGLFNLAEEKVKEKYGTYYYEGNPKDGGSYIYIWYPDITLKAELAIDDYGNTKGDSIDGKSINKDTLVSFKIIAPEVTSAKLIFTTPSGGKIHTFGGYVNKDGKFVAYTFDPEGQDPDHELAPMNQDGAFIAVAPGNEAEAGTWTVQAQYVEPEEFKNQAKKSNIITFDVRSPSLTLTATKDSVVRSNPFAVTVSGAALTEYELIIEPGGIDFLDGQDIVKNSDQNATIKTDASGQITVELTTTAQTEAKTYTIKVCGKQDTSNCDTAKVKVEKGEVTITSSDSSYYFGNEIKLTGTNTDSSKVYLFVTGPNLNDFSLATADVKTDNTWEYKWKTSATGLDTGAYTIYATSVPKLELANSEYAAISVNLKQPFLSANPSGTVVAKGDKIYLRGTAEGNPSTLNIYIFGPNFFKPYSVSVKDDGSYEKKIEIPLTMSSTQYFVVVQHPMYNGVFDAKLDSNDPNPFSMDTIYEWYFKTDIDTTGGDAQSFTVWGNNKLQSSTAADALTKIIDSSNIDDIYTKLTFTVTEPMIIVNTPEDQEVGSSFTISGTTNLAVDDQILVEVMSSSFTATDKTSTDVTSGVSRTAKVVAGEGTDNTWSVTVDTTNWKLDEYTIKVTGIGVGGAAATNFNLVKKSSDTPTPTATNTTSTTTATETPATPGFGALVALTGLGSVALLVLRRN